ncbi:PleD family two-component system response regulator [Thermodesulfovibrio sp. TK110]
MPKAIICEPNEEVQKFLADYLKSAGFECFTFSNSKEALNAMEDASLIIIAEQFNEIIEATSSLPMYQRRDLIAILLSLSIPTMDRLSAFVKGVDFIVNVKDINNFPAIFKRAYVEHQKTYKLFKETLSKLS